MNDEEIISSTHHHNPPKNVVMGIIIFLAVMGVAVGVLSIIRNVRSPFIFGTDPSKTASLDMSEQAQAAQRAESLKSQDTDGDGVSDFDEMYTYKTSPYLKDTDSDGFDDKTEIATGHDANCPEGQNCFRQDLAAKPSTDLDLPGALSGILNSPLIDEVQGLSTAATPTSLRAMLLKKGMSQEQIDQFDDATLMDAYNTAKAKISSVTTDTGNIPVIPSIAPSVTQPVVSTNPTDYSQMSADQIRQLARSSGLISEEQLSQIDDATLKDLFLKAVNKTQQSNTTGQ